MRVGFLQILYPKNQRNHLYRLQYCRRGFYEHRFDRSGFRQLRFIPLRICESQCKQGQFQDQLQLHHRPDENQIKKGCLFVERSKRTPLQTRTRHKIKHDYPLYVPILKNGTRMTRI